MKKWFALMVVAAVSSVSLQGAGVLAQGKPNFEGMWRAAQPANGITAARIFQQAGGLQVQVWGACKPVDCDWGATSFLQLPDAELKLPDRGFALYSGRYATFRLEGGELVIELYRVPETASAVRPHFGIIRLAREK